MWLLHGRRHSFEADWWSSGVLLHTLLTGQTPFEAESLHELFQLLRDPELAVVLPVPEEEDEEEEGGGGDGAARAAHPQRGGAQAGLAGGFAVHERTASACSSTPACSRSPPAKEDAADEWQPDASRRIVVGRAPASRSGPALPARPVPRGASRPEGRGLLSPRGGESRESSRAALRRVVDEGVRRSRLWLHAQIWL